MVGRQPAVLEPFTRVSPALVGAAAAGITGSLLLIRLKPVGDAEAHAWTRVAFTGCYAVMMWSLLRLTIGFFLRVFPSATHDSPCRHTHPWVHYLADSSYAIYLAHFPLVIALQALVAAIPVHWGIKLVFIFGITMAVLLPIYDVLVRPTLIGKILNGRRKPSVLVSAWTMRIEPEGERDSVGMASASGTDVDVETVPGLPPK
jgi:peptidoglycan/LPS O-acetylase OafA/YrhL